MRPATAGPGADSDAIATSEQPGQAADAAHLQCVENLLVTKRFTGSPEDADLARADSLARDFDA